MPPSLTCPPPPTSSASVVAIFGGGEPPAEAHWMLGEPDLPGGIDYERWTPLVAPAPREAFADRLDLVEFFDD